MVTQVLFAPELGQVALPRIAEHGHDRVASTQFARRTHRSDAVQRARAAHEEPFFSEQEPRHLDDLVVGDEEGIVDLCAQKVLREAIDANALCDGIVSVCICSASLIVFDLAFSQWDHQGKSHTGVVALLPRIAAECSRRCFEPTEEEKQAKVAMRNLLLSSRGARCWYLVVQARAWRISEEDLDVWVLFFQIRGDSRDRSSGAYGSRCNPVPRLANRIRTSMQLVHALALLFVT